MLRFVNFNFIYFQKNLYQKCKDAGILCEINSVVEVGVYYNSSIHEFIENGYESILVDANPYVCTFLKKKYAKNKNARIENYAIVSPSQFCSNKDYREFLDFGASSFMCGIESPAKKNDSNKETSLFKSKPAVLSDIIFFKKKESIQIDLLAIDIEGCDFNALDGLNTSVYPKVISIETHGGRYKNPNIDLINKWMKNRDYRVWYRTESDTVFIRWDIIVPIKSYFI